MLNITVVLECCACFCDAVEIYPVVCLLGNFRYVSFAFVVEICIDGLLHWNVRENGGNGFAVEPNNCYYSNPVCSIGVSGECRF